MRLDIFLFALGIAQFAPADDWPGPQTREVFSHSRAYFVRVIPGTSWGDTYGFKGAAKGPFAKAEFYRLEKDRSYRLTATAFLLNPIAPVDFFVTDRGFLIGLDNWHNRGYGAVAAFYTPAGEVIRRYELNGLFTKTEIDAFEHSESSISWRRPTGAYVRDDQGTFYVTGNDPGACFVFEVANGGYQYCENKNGSSQCRRSNTTRTWAPYQEPSRH